MIICTTISGKEYSGTPALKELPTLKITSNNIRARVTIKKPSVDCRHAHISGTPVELEWLANSLLLAASEVKAKMRL